MIPKNRTGSTKYIVRNGVDVPLLQNHGTRERVNCPLQLNLSLIEVQKQTTT